MDAKQYLQQVRWLDRTVDAKLAQIDNLKELSQRVTANYSGIGKVQASQRNDQLSDIVSKIVDLQKELMADIEELVEVEAEVRYKIDHLENDDYKLLLTLRYLNFMTWEQIALEMHYELRWIFVLHKRALNYFSKNCECA